MALVDDLLNDIADPELRARLREQIAVLRKGKKFGLVFEHHLPELLALPDSSIRHGTRVAHQRNGAIGQTYIVDRVRGSSKRSSNPRGRTPHRKSGRTHAAL